MLFGLSGGFCLSSEMFYLIPVSNGGGRGVMIGELDRDAKEE